MNSVPTEITTVYIETYGCQMNVYDSAVMKGLLAGGEFAAVAEPDTADVVLLNTCSVREHAEHRVMSRVGELAARRQRGDGPAVIGICGCMAERLGKDLLGSNSAVDLVVGVDQYNRLPAMLTALVASDRGQGRVAVGHRPETLYVAPPEAYPTNNSHLVTIHKGCDYRCTYCIVPATRGPQQEKNPAVILDEIDRIVTGGGREVTLLGQNVTAYLWQEELDFAGLLRRVAVVPELQRIRFLTGHPRDMSNGLLETIAAEPKICPALHLPMQSGSDRILRRMKRLYRRADYLDIVERAREKMPEVTFSTDFIVGFPGETEADFHDTLTALRRVGFDQVFSFKYSPRPGAPASRLADDVPEPEKKRRLAELIAAQDEIWSELAARQVGEVWRVVIEGPARRPVGAFKARTANNRKVIVEAPGARIGDVLNVRIRGFRNTTFRGEPFSQSR